MKKYFIPEKLVKGKLVSTDENYIPNELSNTWFLESPIDYEYKYYKFMAYLQRLEQNIKNGYMFEEFVQLEKRYKDLESFHSSFQIVDKSKNSEKLLNYIYNLPDDSLFVEDIKKITKMALDKMLLVYIDILDKITNIYKNTKIIRNSIIDRRKNINIYIEKCNCGIFEIFQLSKSGKIKYIGHTENNPNNNSNENLIIIESENAALNCIGEIIPFQLKKAGSLSLN